MSPEGWAAAFRVARVLLLAFALFAAFAWLASERIIFQPPAPSYAAGDEVLRFPTGDGRSVAGVWLPAPGARHAVLFSHGNAEDLGHGRPFLEAMRRAGFSVLAYDYAGYGLSGGRPSERAAYRDAQAAYDHLTGALGVPPDRVIVHGRSLGGAVAAHLAARNPCAGLVLESTFVSAFRVVPVGRILPFDRFRTASRLPAVECPVLVIHGSADEVIPAWHGRRLYDLAPGEKRALWVPGAGHNDLEWVAGERYWDALRAFADGL